ncbi:MAG: acyltransferase [Bacteroidia bacterium]|nr:acyltransferase [Bacteroidia bacterium]
MSEMQTDYFKNLNGFRGLAALSILLFHSRIDCFKTLWIGVPVFFALSGFLITRILILSKTGPNYFKRFYFRRALRIFPIYYLVLVVSVAWCYASKGSFKLLLYFVLYLQSFPVSLSIEPRYFYGRMNYTWSLSVEELFYFAWPLIVLICSEKALKKICIVLGLSGLLFKLIPILFFYSSKTDPFVFASLPGSIDALMAGAFLGILSLKKKEDLYSFFPRHSLQISLLAFSTIFVLYYQNFESAVHFSVFKFLLNLAALLLSFTGIAWLISDKSVLAQRLFNNRFMQLTGNISYGLYLYHYLIYIIIWTVAKNFNLNFSSWIFLPLQIITTYIVAILSWNLIERPLLKLKNKAFNDK